MKKSTFLSSVILCTRNRPADIITCLQSLQTQIVAADQIIVVDSSDIKLTTLEQFNSLFASHHFPSTELTYMHTKPGLTYQRNCGIDLALGQLIYFFDDDVIIDKNYLASMNRVFETTDYAAGMGDITNIKPTSWKYRLFRTIFLLPRQGASGNFTRSGMPTHPYGTQGLRKIEVLGGCCMAFRASIVKQYKFNEFFNGYSYLEDAEIAARIRVDHTIFYNPNARLEHHESPVARDRKSEISKMYAYNYSYLFFNCFYPKNKTKIVAYGWSLLGLFLESLLLRDWQKIKGYSQGLERFYK